MSTSPANPIFFVPVDHQGLCRRRIIAGGVGLSGLILFVASLRLANRFPEGSWPRRGFSVISMSSAVVALAGVAVMTSLPSEEEQEIRGQNDRVRHWRRSRSQLPYLSWVLDTYHPPAFGHHLWRQDLIYLKALDFGVLGRSLNGQHVVCGRVARPASEVFERRIVTCVEAIIYYRRQLMLPRTWCGFENEYTTWVRREIGSYLGQLAFLIGCFEDPTNQDTMQARKGMLATRIARADWLDTPLDTLTQKMWVDD